MAYRCWNCELLHGADDEPIEPSRLCPACEAAMYPRREREDDRGKGANKEKISKRKYTTDY